VETARALAAQGAEVTLAIRNLASGQRVADSIAKGTGISVLVTHVDLTELASVQRFTAAWDGPLHILINNAGVMAPPSRELRHGWELQFATNHLGHFALATGLHSALAQPGDARVVAVSSPTPTTGTPTTACSG
jgi:NAD(P)-dependent dehydrogenase (short-subunit alcohol dehydrogenase family)